MFAGSRSGSKAARVAECDGSATLCILCAGACIMFCDSFLDLIGDADIKSLVRTFYDIDKPFFH